MQVVAETRASNFGGVWSREDAMAGLVRNRIAAKRKSKRRTATAGGRGFGNEVEARMGTSFLGMAWVSYPYLAPPSFPRRLHPRRAEQRRPRPASRVLRRPRSS